jgi:ATP/maltotriose-dependent transcriptional regulator MalT
LREIFEGRGRDQAFLLKTSSFRKFTADMATELTQNPQAAQILSDLSRKNYFTQRHAAETRCISTTACFVSFFSNKPLMLVPRKNFAGFGTMQQGFVKEPGRVRCG